MEQSAEVKEFILRMYQAMAQGDANFFERHTSRHDGLLGIGTDPNEWWEGYTRAVEVWRAQMEAMGGGFPIVAGDPVAYREGSVAWAADRPEVRMPDGSALPFRLTAVLHEEDGDWKLVQWHGSLGVLNEEAFGQDLPT